MYRPDARTMPPDAHPETRVTAMMWARTVVMIVLAPALLLFGAAGTLRWPMAWLYLGLSVSAFAISRLIVWRVHPDLLGERGRMLDHEDMEPFDRLLALLPALVFPTLIALTAGFARRLGWQPAFGPTGEWTGVGLYVLGAALGT